MALGTGQQRRARGSLSTDQVVDAALELATEYGLDAVSMPRLARALGCGAMTLYRYVDDKDQLLALLCSRILRDLPLARTPGIGWESALRGLAVALRGRIAQVPALGQLLVDRAMWSPEVADILEWLLTELTVGGWPTRDAIRAFHAVQHYTLGFALYERSRTRGGSTEAHQRWWRHTLVDLPADTHPMTHAAADFLADGPQEQQFHWGLDDLLDGLRQRLQREQTKRE